MKHLSHPAIRAIVRALVIAALPLALGLSLWPASPATAAELSYYLPAATEYDPAVPTPSAVLGQEIGEWHLRHDQLVRYVRTVAAASDRLTVEVQGRTHEGREQLLVIATAPANHGRLEEIRQRHLALSDPQAAAPSDAALAEMPAVVLLGYSIHGNEASGSNAAALLVYHLAAARGPQIEAALAELVILIDPSFNPDGMGRFASWANSHRALVPVADPESREHREGWPNGRTNHYWFDLNRDWLLLQHPESRNRIETFHRWKPNLLGDYHEMGSDGTYFFQPGVASRKNPWTPAKNVELTSLIADLHAAYFDADGQLYYTEETFDDFYPGKGSTYPDLNGGVGVLFEQGSARGHRMRTVHGVREFSQAVRNHLHTSFSMIDGARQHRESLLRYQNDFYRGAAEAAARDAVGGYLLAFPHDPVRAYQALDLLRRHRIAVYPLAEDLTLAADLTLAEDRTLAEDTTPAAAGRTFRAGESWVVPLAQPQYRLVRTLFERRQEFEDSTFYDVSTWPLPLAYGAVHAELSRAEMARVVMEEPVTDPAFPAAALPTGGNPAPYAYLIDPRGSLVPRAVNSLLAAGHRAYLSMTDFEAVVAGGRRAFPAGTVVVPAIEGAAALRAELRRLTVRDSLDIAATATGRTAAGLDLGSPSVQPLALPRPALVVGDGVSTYEAGEIWYLLDHHYGIELSLLDKDRLGRVDLAPYSHLLMVDGNYRDLDDETVAAIRRWVRAGGTLVTTQSASDWALQRIVREPKPAGGAQTDGAAQLSAERGAVDSAAVEKAAVESPEPQLGRYADYAGERAKELVSGAVLEARLDLTHPLAFGYQEETLALFRTASRPMEASDNPYENVALYTAEPWLSGYLSPRNQERLAGTAALTAARLGEGAVIRFADDPYFRAYWRAPSRLYLNALFVGTLLEEVQPPSRW